MKKIKKFRLVLFSLILILCLISAFLIFKVPDLSVEKITNISQTLTIFDKNNEVCAKINSGENRQNVNFEEIPKHTVNALIATEDIRFYQHNGIDIKRIIGAILADIKAGDFKEGASTITQQLIKNSHLSNEKTIMRKINEAILALQLERKYDKNEILEMYLNFVYFGRGAYGIQAAAKAYFGIDAKDLSCPQSAVLIGILKAPNKYAPHINMEKCISRRNTVLSQMHKYGFISQSEFEQYKNEKITVVEQEKIGDYGYFTDYVLEEGASVLGISVSDFMGSGYKVYTTLDSYLQTELQNIYDDENNFPNKDVQSASVVIDNNSGGISAMIGGREHQGMRLFNRATANRQPGSCIKPVLVYAPAFEKGTITSATILDDYRKDFNGYRPTNYKDVYYGKVTVRDALKLSLNIPAVDLLDKTGVEYSKQFAKNAGIEFDDSDLNLAISLGGMKYGTSVLKLAGAYRCFAMNGKYVEPWCIEKITDYDGNILYQHQTQEKHVFKDSTAFIITDILCEVSKQTNNPLNKLKYPVACKTGTVAYTQGNSDALSTAYTKNHTVSVWMGYDKTDSENHLDSSVTGSSYPSQIVYYIFNKIVNKYQYESFIMPESVVYKEIDAYSLKKENKIYLATEYTPKNNIIKEYFDIDNCPKYSSDYWESPQKIDKIYAQLNELRHMEISFNAKQNFVDYVIYKNNTKVAVLWGNKGEKLIYTDKEYNQDDSYYIVPVHKIINVNGSGLQGEKSKEIKLN